MASRLEWLEESTSPEVLERCRQVRAEGVDAVFFFVNPERDLTREEIEEAWLAWEKAPSRVVTSIDRHLPTVRFDAPFD